LDAKDEEINHPNIGAEKGGWGRVGLIMGLACIPPLSSSTYAILPYIIQLVGPQVSGIIYAAIVLS
jgi:hypothetical protein